MSAPSRPDRGWANRAGRDNAAAEPRNAKSRLEKENPFSSNGLRLRFLLRFNVSSELMDSLHEFEHFINMPGHFHSTPFFH